MTVFICYSGSSLGAEGQSRAGADPHSMGGPAPRLGAPDPVRVPGHPAPAQVPAQDRGWPGRRGGGEGPGGREAVPGRRWQAKGGCVCAEAPSAHALCPTGLHRQNANPGWRSSQLQDRSRRPERPPRAVAAGALRDGSVCRRARLVRPPDPAGREGTSKHSGVGFLN